MTIKAPGVGPEMHVTPTVTPKQQKKAQGSVKAANVKPDELKFSPEAKAIRNQRAIAKKQKVAQLRSEIAEMGKQKKAAMLAHQQNINANIKNAEAVKQMKADFKVELKKFENERKSKISALNNLLGIKPKKPNKTVMGKAKEFFSNIGKQINKSKGLVAAGVVGSALAIAGIIALVKNAKAKKARKAEFEAEA